jgi:hypothetical protein
VLRISLDGGVKGQTCSIIGSFYDLGRQPELFEDVEKRFFLEGLLIHIDDDLPEILFSSGKYRWPVSMFQRRA